MSCACALLLSSVGIALATLLNQDLAASRAAVRNLRMSTRKDGQEVRGELLRKGRWRPLRMLTEIELSGPLEVTLVPRRIFVDGVEVTSSLAAASIAQVHFATERKYMAPYAAEIPNYELHMQEHREFFSDAIGFLLDYLDRGTATTPDLLAYLESWWAKHVGGTDKVMGSILRSKGIA